MTWTAVNGTITASGLYTAPASGPTDTITATSTENPAESGLAAITLVAPPATPTIVLTPAGGADKVRGNLYAAVPPQEGCTYAWTITGGVINTGAGTNLISYTTDAVPFVTLTCKVINAAGTASAPASATLTVFNSGAPVQTITVGGTVTGLNGNNPNGTALVLQINAENNLIIPANGSFTFGMPLATGTPYNVRVMAQPDGQVCTVSNGSGTAGTQAITNLVVTCVNAPAPYPLAAPAINLNAQVVGSAERPFTAGLSTEKIFAMRNAIVADLNGTGYPDVIVSYVTVPDLVPQPIEIIDASQDLAFPASTLFSGSVPYTVVTNNMLFTDINGDGLPDLVIADEGTEITPNETAPISVAINQGGGLFDNVSSRLPSAVQQTQNYSIAAGDLYNDGKTWVLLDGGPTAIHWNGSGFDVRNNPIDPATLWADPTGLGQNAWMALADFDQDGTQDLLVGSNQFHPNFQILWGDPTGYNLWNLSELPPGPWGWTPLYLMNTPGNATVQGSNQDRVVVADFNNDGLLDIFALEELITTYEPGALTDTNWPDYPNVNANGGFENRNIGLQVLLNQGNRNFINYGSESTQVDLGMKYYVGCWPFDLNNDGLVDVVGVYYTKTYGTQLGLGWGSTFFLNDGTGAFQIVDGAQLFPSILNLGSTGVSQLGCLFPTKVTRQAMEGVLAIQNNNAIPPSYTYEKIVTAGSLGTGPGLVDGATLGVPGFNEFFYLHKYPDVSALVRAGTYSSGLDHFVRAGKAMGYQAFSQHAKVWGGSSAAAVTLYGDNTYNCGTVGDSITTTGGNNRVNSGPGNDTIMAASPSDTVTYSGPSTRYVVTDNANSTVTVADTALPGDGVDTISGACTLKFTDKSISVN